LRLGSSLLTGQLRWCSGNQSIRSPEIIAINNASTLARVQQGCHPTGIIRSFLFNSRVAALAGWKTAAIIFRRRALLKRMSSCFSELPRNAFVKSVGSSVVSKISLTVDVGVTADQIMF
jgi:hypothetical protein